MYADVTGGCPSGVAGALRQVTLEEHGGSERHGGTGGLIDGGREFVDPALIAQVPLDAGEPSFVGCGDRAAYLTSTGNELPGDRDTGDRIAKPIHDSDLRRG